jgi:hypothetical protein
MDSLPAKALPRVFEVTAETRGTLAPGSQLEITATAESSESNANADDNHANYTLYVQPVGKMPWRECCKVDERLRFVARLLEGEKMAV